MSKVVYIVLTETGSLLSKAIQLYTHENFNHVSISFDKELRKMYSFGRKRENNPFIGGFVHENPASKLLKDANCAVYACPVSEEQFLLLKNIVEHYEINKHEYKYNFIGLFGVACRLKLKRDNAFFCSQFIATLFERVGLSLCGKCPYFMKPTDFAKLPYMQLRYIGDVKNYTHIYQTKPLEKIPVSTIQYIA